MYMLCSWVELAEQEQGRINCNRNLTDRSIRSLIFVFCLLMKVIVSFERRFDIFTA